LEYIVTNAIMNCRVQWCYWLGAKSTNFLTTDYKGRIQFHQARCVPDCCCSSARLQTNMWWKTQREGDVWC